MIAEDSVLLRIGLVKVVEMAGFEVAAEAGDGQELLAAVEEHRPDLAVVDVRMPPGFTDEGVRAALAIRQKWPDTAVLMLSQYVEERYAADLLATNTSGVGYLLKQRVADVEEFIEALRRVAGGGTALDPQVVAQLLVRRASDPLERLTARERDVLALMAEGRSNAGIAAQLVVSESAVAKHINNILAKLDLPKADADHRRVLAVLRFLGVGARGWCVPVLRGVMCLHGMARGAGSMTCSGAGSGTVPGPGLSPGSLASGSVVLARAFRLECLGHRETVFVNVVSSDKAVFDCEM